MFVMFADKLSKNIFQRIFELKLSSKPCFLQKTDRNYLFQGRKIIIQTFLARRCLINRRIISKPLYFFILFMFSRQIQFIVFVMSIFFVGVF